MTYFVNNKRAKELDKMKTIKELEAKEKEAMKGCGEKPVDEEEGMVLSFNNGIASISKCGNNNEYCPLCAVKIQKILAEKKALKNVLKLIDEEILYYENKLINLKGYMPMIHAHNISQVKGRLDMLKELKSKIQG